jgi:DNA-binding XRE family transcriptional regulator
VTHTQDPEQVERDIEQTREELGETVEALARKADVKAQAKQRIEDVKGSVSEKKDELTRKARDVSPDSTAGAASQVTETARANPLPLAAAGAFLAGFLAGRALKR